jgi:integrase
MAKEWIKWIKTAHKGLRYYEHESIKHGKKWDRYYSIRFKVDKKDYSYGIGWWSEGIPEEILKDDPQLGFEDYCLKLLREYKGNLKAGAGPQSPKEKRSKEEKRREAEKALSEERKKEEITFKQYFEKVYYPAVQAGKKRDTFRKNKEHFDKWIEPVIGNVPLKELNRFILEKIKTNILSDKKSPRLIQYVFATIRATWNMARKDGIVTGDSPTKLVKLPKFDNRRVRFLSYKEADGILKALQDKDPMTCNIATLSLHSGLRMGEIRSLQWSHIDIERGIITVMDPKNSEGRAAFMTDQVKTMFEAMARQSPDSYIFTDKDGKKLKETPKIFAEIVKDVGLNKGISDPRQRVYFHTLRHTFASWHVEAGTDIYILKELLGHSVIAMTARYSHLGKNTLQAATKNFQEAVTHTTQQQAEQDENVVNIAG